MKTNLTKLATHRQTLGFEPSPLISAEVARLDRDWQVAVVGEFKVGKSTLINRVLLENDLLPRDLLECTAVPTLIRHGTIPSLTITNFSDDGGTAAPLTCEPTPEAIAEAVTRDTPEGRSDLARRTASVALTWPCPPLAGFGIYDTPGVNSGNEAVVTTTYRVVPESDCVIFLKTDRQISQAEREFLTSHILDQGLTHVLVLVAFNDRGGGTNATTVANVLKATRAGLNNLGRESLRVEAISLDSEDPIEGTISGVAIRDLITQFVTEHARPGREARAAHVVRQEATQLMVAVQTELAAMQASVEQRQELTKRIETQQARLAKEHDGLVEEAELDVKLARQKCVADIKAGLFKVGQNFANGFTEAMSLAQMQQRLHEAALVLRPELEQLTLQAIGELRKSCTVVAERIGASSAAMSGDWQVVAVDELHIDGGILAKAPPWSLYVADILLVDTVSPFPLFIDIILREVIKRIPGLNALMPVNIVKNMFRATILNAITPAMNNLAESVAPKLENALQGSVASLRHALATTAEAEMASALAALKSAASAPDPVRRQLLEQVRDDLKPLCA